MKCIVEGCCNKPWASRAYNQGYCKKHYKLLADKELYKKFTAGVGRRVKPNEVVKYDAYAEIIMVDASGVENGRAIVDLDDLERVNKYRWSINMYGYVVGKINNKSIRLHRFIMNPDKDLVVDHINHNKLDNRKLNLRVCTNQQNSFNKKVKGVRELKSGKKRFEARIKVNGKSISKRFESLEEAIKHRRELESQYFGEYAFNKDC